MKKALTILVAMLFLVVAVGVAYSAETTFNGQYKVRAWTNWNFDKRPTHLTSERGLFTGYFDQRFRLTVTHTRSEFLKAVVQLDLVEDTWGQQRNFRINNYPEDTGMVRKAYIEFTLPKMGTFTLGKQPEVFGQGLVFSDTLGYLDGIKWANKWGPVGVEAMYFKWNDRVSEGGLSKFYNRDNDIWALHLTVTPNDMHTIELYGGYAKFASGIPLSHNAAIHGWTSELYTADVGFAGLAYTGEINNMLTLKAEFSGVFGKADYTDVGGPADRFIGGYNIYLDAAYHTDMFKVGLAFILGSGDTSKRYAHDKLNLNYITATEFAFSNILVGGNGGANDDYAGGLSLGDDLENVTAVKLYAECYPTEKLSLNAAVIWAKWTEPIGPGTPYNVHPIDYHFSGITYTAADKSTDLGWEVDLGLSYKIMEGLTYNLYTGVLFTGDSYDYSVGGVEHAWGPIWSVTNELLYEF